MENYYVSSDPAELDIDFIHGFLTRSYWSEGISREIVEKAIRGSLCFGVFVDGRQAGHTLQQAGFARMITDKATFAYLADVFIHEDYRDRGLGKLLMKSILAHPDLQGLRRIILATRDAHGLYRRFGFTALNNPERWMQIHQPDVYKTGKTGTVRPG
jgi:N-acetylglutamate synthase-like GNAT family acetyltransferase